MHPAGLDDAALLAACEVRRTRGSGPGGQHRNKVETAIEIRHRPSGVTVSATERRSQAANLRVATHRLRLALAVAVRTERAGKPSELWRSRRHGRRVVVSARHRDLAPLIAEALDVLCAHDWDGGAASALLDVTQSQLVKLLTRHPPALAAWNAARAERGLRPLR